MTPTTSEREARELLAREYERSGMNVSAAILRDKRENEITGAAIRAIIAALTREQRDDDAKCDCGANADNRWPHHDECALNQPQPEAQGAVAWACMDGERMMRVSHSREEMLLQAHGRDWTVEPLGLLNATTPPAPVDVRYSAVGYVTEEGATYYTENFCTRSLKPKPGTVLYVLDGQQAGVDWQVIAEGLRLADQFFDGQDDYWQWDNGETFPGSKVRAAHNTLQAALGGGGRG